MINITLRGQGKIFINTIVIKLFPNTALSRNDLMTIFSAFNPLGQNNITNFLNNLVTNGWITESPNLQITQQSIDKVLKGTIINNLYPNQRKNLTELGDSFSQYRGYVTRPMLTTAINDLVASSEVIFNAGNVTPELVSSYNTLRRNIIYDAYFNGSVDRNYYYRKFSNQEVPITNVEIDAAIEQLKTLGFLQEL